MPRLVKFAAALLAFATLGAGHRLRAAADAGVQITQLPDRLRVELNGKLFTEYFFTNVPRPYFYPLIGPGELALTRDWPMKNTPGEEHDHPHHRSLWFAHGAVNGHDFWSEAKDFGRIDHVAFLEVKSGPAQGVIRSSNNWVLPDSALVCSDERTMRIYSPQDPNERMFDFEITLYASHGDVTFGDTKEGAMAVRLAESMRLKTSPGQAHIVTSAGDRDGATWGKRADWCDYSGPVNGKLVGVAIFDHPQNPRHPTWWHVRDYGLFAANPFGKHDFEKLHDASAGNFAIPAGQSATFRYRFLLHAGDERPAKVAQQYADYSKAKQ
jgi:hypothetical protein